MARIVLVLLALSCVAISIPAIAQEKPDAKMKRCQNYCTRVCPQSHNPTVCQGKCIHNCLTKGTIQ